MKMQKQIVMIKATRLDNIHRSLQKTIQHMHKILVSFFLSSFLYAKC